jgi:colicin import membrane protein
MLTETGIVPASTTIEEYAKTALSLVELDRRYKGVQYDVNTKDGLLAATKARAELRTLRVALEKTRVAIKAPALKRTQEIDTEARRLTAAISELEDPIDGQIKAEETRKENERMAAEQAEQERIAAEQEALRLVEHKKIEEAQAEIRRRQEELDRAENELRDKEIEANRIIEEQARTARLKIEEEERQAMAVRDEQNRLARLARDEEELKARKEREKKETEQRAAEEKKRKAKEKEEEKQRKIQRRANDVQDANALLTSFVHRFGHLEEFMSVTAAITAFLEKEL